MYCSLLKYSNPGSSCLPRFGSGRDWKLSPVSVIVIEALQEPQNSAIVRNREKRKRLAISIFLFNFNVQKSPDDHSITKRWGGLTTPRRWFVGSSPLPKELIRTQSNNGVGCRTSQQLLQRRTSFLTGTKIPLNHGLSHGYGHTGMTTLFHWKLPAQKSKIDAKRTRNRQKQRSRSESCFAFETNLHP